MQRENAGGKGRWEEGDGDLRGFTGVCTHRRWRPKAGEVEQREAGGVGILLAALAFVQGGPLSKGNEQRDEQRERKPERERKEKGNGQGPGWAAPATGSWWLRLLRFRSRGGERAEAGQMKGRDDKAAAWWCWDRWR